MHQKLIEPFTKIYEFRGWKQKTSADRVFIAERKAIYQQFDNGSDCFYELAVYLKSGTRRLVYHRLDGPAFAIFNTRLYYVGGISFFRTESGQPTDFWRHHDIQTVEASHYGKAVELWYSVFGVDWLNTINPTTWYFDWKKEVGNAKLRYDPR